MGYYTTHKLRAFENQTTLFGENPEVDLTQFEDLPGVRYAIYEDGRSYDQVKWYEHDEEMLAFSKKHPDIVFQLQGEGEESGDVWCTYYMNGKRVHHEMPEWTPPEFDPSQLT